MPSPTEEKLCTYYYDALDRLTGLQPDKQGDLQRFYCNNRLATEIQGQEQFSIMQQGELVLAQQHRVGGSVETELLVTDQQRSVLQTVGSFPRPQIAYSPFGHRSAASGLASLLGFNGERLDAIMGRYSLGNGYRAFNPVLMRFDCPDKLSPFGKGGMNAYAYCSGDPVNRRDPSGKSWFGMTTRQLHGLWLSYTKKSFSFDLGESMILSGEKSKNLIKQSPKATGKNELWRNIELSEEVADHAKANADRRISSESAAETLIESDRIYIENHSKKHIFVMDDLKDAVSKDVGTISWQDGSVLSPALTKLNSEVFTRRLDVEVLRRENLSLKLNELEVFKQRFRMKLKLIRK